MYKNALVAKQQLEEVGFKIDLQVVDWATLVQRRNKPELFDVFSTGITFNPEPAFSTGVAVQLAGLVVPRGQGAVARQRWRARPTPSKRKAMWDKVQALFYEDVGRVKFGDWFALEARSARTCQGSRTRQGELHALERLAAK